MADGRCAPLTADAERVTLRALAGVGYATYAVTMRDVLGWIAVGLVPGMMLMLLVTAMRHVFSRRPIEHRYRGMVNGGLVGIFDAIWSPSAHEASMERDRQQRASIPAPTPDKGPGRMDEAGRIVIEVDER